MIITLTGSSGAGKTTYCKELMARKPDWKLVPSYTSRAPRQTDMPGEYVYNVSPEEFARMMKSGESLWEVKEHGNTYATARSDVSEAAGKLGPHIMLITPNTVGTLREFLKTEQRSLLHFYLLSPSEEELRKRLARRNASKEGISQRISDCQTWDSEAINSEIPYSFVRGDILIEDAVGSMLETYEIFFPKGDRK